MDSYYAIVGTIIIGLIGVAVFVLSQEGPVKKKTKKDGLKPRGARARSLSPLRRAFFAHRLHERLRLSLRVAQRICTRSDCGARRWGGGETANWQLSSTFFFLDVLPALRARELSENWRARAVEVALWGASFAKMKYTAVGVTHNVRAEARPLSLARHTTAPRSHPTLLYSRYCGLLASGISRSKPRQRHGGPSAETSRRYSR